MKVIIAGSREITDYALVETAVVESGFVITEVVSGGARGVDMLGERYAFEHKIPVKRFPADWKKFGKSAGPRRNAEMADYGDGLIALWLDQSHGTASMIGLAHRKNLRVYVKAIGSRRVA